MSPAHHGHTYFLVQYLVHGCHTCTLQRSMDRPAVGAQSINTSEKLNSDVSFQNHDQVTQHNPHTLLWSYFSFSKLHPPTVSPCRMKRIYSWAVFYQSS